MNEGWCNGPVRDGRRQERRQSIIDAAEALFLEHGYERVSLGTIVRRSGGSLATLYEMFGSKQGLLRAVVDHVREEEMKDLRDIDWDRWSPSEILRLFGRRYHDFATSPKTVALMRLVITESFSDPKFGRSFNEEMQEKIIDQIASCFERWTAAGKAKVDRPKAAAELYFAAVLCHSPIKAMLGVALPSDCDEMLQWRLAPLLKHFEMS
ncbi:MAG TPA: TetR/AcrR family transcriptional regulator [Allosphingosinicella sp.]|nr:TetR/AcrR family transcriptional regulator [Allosphingosinicella sp.]